MNEQKKICQFAHLAPAWFLRHLIRRYSLDIPQFERFMPWFLAPGDGEFRDLVPNRQLKWSMETFLKYQSILGLDYLSQARPEDFEACYWWIPELYEKHPEYYTLPGIAGATNFWDWDAEKLAEWAPLFDAYGTRYDPLNNGYYSAWRGISSNSRVQWTPELLQHYADRVDWVALSEFFPLPWSEGEILQFENRWSWTYLSRNRKIIWTPLMVRRHDNYVRDLISETNAAYADPQIMLDYADQLNWQMMNYNPYIRWDLGLFEKLLHRIHWSQFSETTKNRYFPWSADFIERHADKIDFKALSLNSHPGIPWSEAFIRHYSDRLSLENLLKNPVIPWSLNTLEEYAAKLPELKVWERVSKNQTLNWSPEFLDTHRQDWDWDALAENPKVPWSLDLMLEFSPEVQTISAPSDKANSLWQRFVAPYLDDDLLMTILEEITAQLPKFKG